MEHILVVEDEPIIARDIEDSLCSAGYAVAAVAASGEEALNKIPLTQPDLVLMDIVLRGSMDGLETAAAIRHRFDIPIVYLTGYADRQTLERAKLTSPFGYLLKPFNDRELQITIAMALYQHERDRQDRLRTQWFGAALQSLGQAVLVSDQGARVRFLNRLAEGLTGWAAADALGRPLDEVLRIEAVAASATTESPPPSSDPAAPREAALRSRDGRRRFVTVTAVPLTDERGREAGLLHVFQEQGAAATPVPSKRRGAGGHSAHASGEAARGFIPICASCKKMRDEAGDWHQPEVYLKARTGAEFTHGICPDCMRRIYKLTKDRPPS